MTTEYYEPYHCMAHGQSWLLKTTGQEPSPSAFAPCGDGWCAARAVRRFGPLAVRGRALDPSQCTLAGFHLALAGASTGRAYGPDGTPTRAPLVVIEYLSAL